MIELVCISAPHFGHFTISSFREGSASRASMYPTLPHMGRQLGKNLCNDLVTEFTGFAAAKLLPSKLLAWLLGDLGR